MGEVEFRAYPKVPRLFREFTITEKIDGTNGVIHIDEAGAVRAGSRNRWVTPESDNFGFARWVGENAEDLRVLGPGYHYGEWWGLGIQRGYNQNKRRFSLFGAPRIVTPSCCENVPVLEKGDVFEEAILRRTLLELEMYGSKAAEGFMKPEGIMVFLHSPRHMYKVTFDDKHKDN